MSRTRQSEAPKYQTRICEISGPSLPRVAHTVWYIKHGVWFMMKADSILRGWMTEYSGVLCEPSLERMCRLQGLKFRWLS